MNGRCIEPMSLGALGEAAAVSVLMAEEGAKAGRVAMSDLRLGIEGDRGPGAQAASVVDGVLAGPDVLWELSNPIQQAPRVGQRVGYPLAAKGPLGRQQGRVLEQVGGAAHRAAGRAADHGSAHQLEAALVQLGPAPKPAGARGAVIREEGDELALRRAQAAVSRRPRPEAGARANHSDLRIAGANVIGATIAARVDDDHLVRALQFLVQERRDRGVDPGTRVVGEHDHGSLRPPCPLEHALVIAGHGADVIEDREPPAGIHR
jgi:hypothetical protein